MIYPAEIQRLGIALEIAADAGKEAIQTYGRDAQERMAIEECGELVTALARYHRGRATSDDVTEEAADVIMTALQVAIIHGDGLASLADTIERKARRLRVRMAEEAPHA